MKDIDELCHTREHVKNNGMCGRIIIDTHKELNKQEVDRWRSEIETEVIVGGGGEKARNQR